MHADELREDIDHPTGADAAGHVNRQALPGPLVDDRQVFERLPIRTGVEHEVVRPHVVPVGGRQRPGSSRGHAAAGHHAYIEAAALGAGIERQADPRDQTRDYLVQRIDHRTVQDRAGVVAALQKAGFDVPRE